MSTITKFIKVEERTSKLGKPYTISHVIVDDAKEVEVFGLAREGQTGELSYSEQYKKWEFKIAGTPSTGFARVPATKEFKADPAKMAQDKHLAIATNQSIQRQVAMKGTVELIVGGIRKYDDLQVTFDDLMGLLTRKED